MACPSTCDRVALRVSVLAHSGQEPVCASWSTPIPHHHVCRSNHDRPGAACEFAPYACRGSPASLKTPSPNFESVVLDTQKRRLWLATQSAIPPIACHFTRQAFLSSNQPHAPRTSCQQTIRPLSGTRDSSRPISGTHELKCGGLLRHDPAAATISCRHDPAPSVQSQSPA